MKKLLLVLCLFPLAGCESMHDNLKKDTSAALFGKNTVVMGSRATPHEITIKSFTKEENVVKWVAEIPPFLVRPTLWICTKENDTKTGAVIHEPQCVPDPCCN